MRRGSWALIATGVGLLVLAGFLFQHGLDSLASDWAYGMSGIRTAQSRGLDGTGVTVAIVDTGIEADHPSLSHITISAWRDFVNGRATPYDDSGHGSHVSGVLAGSGATFMGKVQGLNMRGAAPGIHLVAVKAIASDGTGSSTNVAAGIDFAVSSGADVVCLSLGGRSNLSLIGDDIEQAVGDAINHGVLVVAAAGNTGQDPSRNDVETPATIRQVIAVGAATRGRDVADFSATGNSDANYGPQGVGGRTSALALRQDPNKKPEVVAPGVGIQSAWMDDGYRIAAGTSQAAPFVCGALALLLEAEPTLKADNSAGMIDRVKAALQKSAEALPDQQRPHDPRAGYGLLRADRLIDQF
jgi:serine protease AprX